MLTRLVRLSLAAEAIACIAVGAVFHSRLGWSVAASATAVAALSLGLRFALVAFTCFHGWLHRSPRPAALQVGLAGTLRLLWTEYLALLADNFVYLPWAPLVLRADPPPPASGLPVVLVHGYLSNRGYFRPMVRWLEGHGVGSIFTPNYRSVFSSIEASAAELAREIERIASQSGAGQVVLVCHSMGGLLARHYLREHCAARVARLVTLASPHHGTVLSRLGVGEHARQMRRDSDFLRSLADSEAGHPPGIPATSVYTVHDNLVAPQDTSRLAWARNVAVAGVGHVGILDSEPVFELVLDELRAAGVSSATG